VRLLVTRPAPDGERTAQALRASGHDVLEAPMLRMQTLAFELADRPYAGVVMTSANAARALGSHPRCAELAKLPAFVVGRHTADAARAVGFADVHCAHGDGGDLAALLRARLGASALPLLYLAGQDRAGEDRAAAGELAPPGVAIITATVYRMVKAGRLPEAVAGALRARGIDGVLHFSKRSAQAYVDCAKVARLLAPALAPVQFCLSRQVADPLAAQRAAGIRIAPHPNEAAILALVNAWTAA
jgi:uroporphyrinogen-III synthase